MVDAFTVAGIASRVYHKEMFFTDEALAGEHAEACPPIIARDNLSTNAV